MEQINSRKDGESGTGGTQAYSVTWEGVIIDTTSSTTVITPNTDTAITLVTPEYENPSGNFWDAGTPTRVTADRDGYWWVDALVQINNPAAFVGTRFDCRGWVQDGSANVLARVRHHFVTLTTANRPFRGWMSFGAELLTGEYLECYLHHAHTANLNGWARIALTWIDATS